MSIPGRYNPKEAYLSWRGWMQNYRIKLTTIANACAPYWPNAYVSLNVLGRDQKLTVLNLVRLYGAQKVLQGGRPVLGIDIDQIAQAMIDEYPALTLDDWAAVTGAMKKYAGADGKLYPHEVKS